MAPRLVPEHNNRYIALRYAEDASPVRIKVSGSISVHHSKTCTLSSLYFLLFFCALPRPRRAYLDVCLQNLFEPIYFYVDSIFALHSLLVCALYTISWLLTGTWLSGVLTAALYIVNRRDTHTATFSANYFSQFAVNHMIYSDHITVRLLHGQFGVTISYYNPSRKINRYLSRSTFFPSKKCYACETHWK